MSDFSPTPGNRANHVPQKTVVSGNTTGNSSSVPRGPLTISAAGAVTAGWSNSNLVISSPLQTNQTLGIYASSQTTGQSSSSTHDARSLTVVGDGIVSVGWSNSSLRISATQSNQAFSAAGGASNFQTLTFADTNGVSWTNTNGSIGVASVKLSMFATSNTTQSSTGTANINSLIFAGAGIASVGISGGSVVVSVPAGGGAGDSGAFVGISNLGNTSGTSGMVSTGNYVLVGSGAITLSQSSSGQNGTLTITVPQTSSIVGTNGLSVNTNGSTISVSLKEISNWRNRMGGATQAGAVQGNSLVSIFPILLQVPVAFSNIMVAGSVNLATAANNSSGYLDVSATAVIYSRNVSTLSSVGSFNNTFTMSHSSNASQTMTGVQGLALTGAATTLTQGEYFVAMHVSTNNTATGGANTTALAKSVSMILADAMGSDAQLVKVWGNQTANSLGLIAGQGIISTGATLATIALSDYTMTGTRGTVAHLAIELRNQTWWG